MSIKTMPPRAMAFLLSEANGGRSRTTVTIASGSGKLHPGTVLGQVTASKKFVPSPDAETAGVEGAETAVAILSYAVDATDKDVTVAAIDNDAEVIVSFLAFDPSVNDQSKTAAKLAQLEAVGIRAR